MLILGGLFIGTITLGGYYASQNPGKVAALLKGPKSGPNVKALDRVLVAAPVCAKAPPNLMQKVCAKANREPVSSWKEGLENNEQACMWQTFHDMTFLEMEYRRDPESYFEEYSGDLDVIYFACSVDDELKQWLPDVRAKNAKGIVAAWYLARLEAMRSVH